jgi:fused signal recognition particle receptor
MLRHIKQAFSKAAALFAGIRTSSDEDIEEILLRADVGVKYTELIMTRVRGARENRFLTLKKEIVRLLSLPKPQTSADYPFVIMVCGVNGSGKTTTVAKLANLYSKDNRVLLACADTYRDAASDQLATWAERMQTDIVLSQRGQDAASVVYDAISKARARSIGTVLIDTAGRLHTRSDLMDELRKIERVIEKMKPKGPDFNILTIDANLGQNSIQQARAFKRNIGINSLILTKFDGTAKGGAIIPICRELEVPVLYLGIGENIGDIIEFDPEAYVEALFEP